MSETVGIEVFPSITNVTIEVGKPEKLTEIQVGKFDGLQLGTTAATAFRGDQGLIAYEHATTAFHIVEAPIDGTPYARQDGLWVGISVLEVNDLTASVTWANVPNVNITQGSVTQHQAALTITESQISDLQSYLLDITGEPLSSLSDVTISSIATGEILKWGGLGWINNTLAEAGIAAVGHVHAAADITSGTFADARISQSSVTQHQAALSITESQISDLGAYLLAEVNDLTDDVTWANVPDANITQSSVTQHQAALAIAETQVTGLRGRGAVTIPDPVSTDDGSLFFTPVAITITDIVSHITGTTNVVFNIQHASTRNGTGLNVFTSNITLTSNSGQTNNTGFNDETIPANSWVWVNIVSVSGTPTMFHTTVLYTED